MDSFFPKNVTGPILCLDIGSGTQDMLLALPDSNPENWPRMVLPAPSRSIAKQIRALTAQKRAIWLYGENMGGGIGGAVSEHLKSGLPLSAHPEAARALNDNLEHVKSMGITITEERPADHVPLRLADFEPGFWRCLLDAAGLPQPVLILAAAQDHGHHPTASNRECRFQSWRQFLEHGDPDQLLYSKPPAVFTRLRTLHEATGRGWVADTGAAAMLGALCAPEVAARSARQGITVVNVGNSHTIAFLIFQQSVYGVYEHHTGLLTRESLLADLDEFRLGWLPDEQVRAKGGHGSAFAASIPPEAESFKPTFILGPKRALLEGQGQFIAPAGDMMLAGCFGLLHGLALLQEGLVG